MVETQNPKHFDLEDRTFHVSKNVALYVRASYLESVSNMEYGRQVVRASRSVEAHYFEANEALSKKDFIMRIKICRKEAKESAYSGYSNYRIKSWKA